MSPEEYRAAADEETYALVDQRRNELFSNEAGFNIEPRQDSLRQRILSGEWEPDRSLGLADFVEIAAENSRAYQSRKESLYRSALDLTLERWRFASQGFGSLDASVVGDGNGATAAQAGGSAGFTKLLGTGATIVTDIGASLFRVVSTGDGWDAVSDIGFAFTQPLMRGMGKRIVQEPLTQAERNLIYEVRDFERFRRTFAVDVADRFYSLLQSIDELGNEEVNYENLIKLRVRNMAMAQAGRLSDIQADQAQQDESRSENSLIVLRTGLERQRDQFNLFLGLPVDVDLVLDEGEFLRLDDQDPLIELITEEWAVPYALEARLDHQTIADVVADRERQVYVAEDALRAGLSLSVSAGSMSEEGRPLNYTPNSASWLTSLSLDLPIDRKAERNAYRRSLINLEVANRNLEEDADNITAGVRDALRLVRNSQKSYILQTGVVALNERRVESSQLNLDAGRSDTRDLLDSRRDLVAAQNDATSALITFTLARLDLYLQLEVLRVDETGIKVEDGFNSSLIEDSR